MATTGGPRPGRAARRQRARRALPRRTGPVGRRRRRGPRRPETAADRSGRHSRRRTPWKPVPPRAHGSRRGRALAGGGSGSHPAHRRTRPPGRVRHPARLVPGTAPTDPSSRSAAGPVSRAATVADREVGCWPSKAATPPRRPGRSGPPAAVVAPPFLCGLVAYPPPPGVSSWRPCVIPDSRAVRAPCGICPGRSAGMPVADPGRVTRGQGMWIPRRSYQRWRSRIAATRRRRSAPRSGSTMATKLAKPSMAASTSGPSPQRLPAGPSRSIW